MSISASPNISKDLRENSSGPIEGPKKKFQLSGLICSIHSINKGTCENSPKDIHLIPSISTLSLRYLIGRLPTSPVGLNTSNFICRPYISLTTRRFRYYLPITLKLHLSGFINLTLKC